MKKIERKYKTLCDEIRWRHKATDYKEEDKAQVVVHETIDKEVSYISIAEVEELTNELGVSKLFEIKNSYIDEFGEFPKGKDNIAEFRLLLYWYFEQRVYDDDEMRKVLKLD